MINAINENFVMHRRFVLTIALKIDNRNKKDKNITVVVIDETNETSETNEKKKNKVIAIDETAKKIKKINKKQYLIINFLTKIFNS